MKAERQRSVITGYGRKWDYSDKARHTTHDVSRDYDDGSMRIEKVLSLKSLIASAKMDIESLQDVNTNKTKFNESYRNDLKRQIALVEAKINSEREEFSRERAQHANLRSDAMNPRDTQMDRELEGIIDMQRKVIQQKDNEIKNLSEIAASQKEQIAMLYCILTPGLENIGQEVLRVPKEKLLKILHPEHRVPYDMSNRYLSQVPRAEHRPPPVVQTIDPGYESLEEY